MRPAQHQIVGVLLIVLVAGGIAPFVAGNQHPTVDQDAATSTEQEAAAEARGGNASVNQEANTNIEQNADVQAGGQNGRQPEQQPQEQEQAQEAAQPTERALLVQIVGLLQAILEELRELTAADVQQTQPDTAAEQERAQERQTTPDQNITVHQETRTEVEQNTEIVTVGPFRVNDPTTTDSVREIVVIKTRNTTGQEQAQEPVQESNRTAPDGQATVNQSATSSIRQGAEATATGNGSATVDQDARSGITQQANATG